jgi:hypothetical protein
MTTPNNILRCTRCGLAIIAEALHECRRVTDYKIKNNLLWLYDGKTWIPRKLLSLSDETSQRDNSSQSDDKLPEPLSETYFM